MPRASGFVVLERLKQHHRLAIPIIMLTGQRQRPPAALRRVPRRRRVPAQAGPPGRAVPGGGPVLPAGRRPGPGGRGRPPLAGGPTRVRTVTGSVPCPIGRPTFKAVPTAGRAGRAQPRPAVPPGRQPAPEDAHAGPDRAVQPRRLPEAVPHLRRPRRSASCAATSTGCWRGCWRPGGTATRSAPPTLKYGRVYDLLTHPRIVALVKDLLGENVIAWGSHFFCKMPRRRQDGLLAPGRQLLAADAVQGGHGLAGHRRRGRRERLHAVHPRLAPLRPPDLPHERGQRANVLDQTVENAEQFGEPVYDELKAGEFSIHSDLLLHGSEANASDRRRCGLTLRYCAADVVAGLGWYEKGIWVSGRAAPGTWANRPRPAND